MNKTERLLKDFALIEERGDEYMTYFKLVHKWQEGHEVVYHIYNNDATNKKVAELRKAIAGIADWRMK